MILCYRPLLSVNQLNKFELIFTMSRYQDKNGGDSYKSKFVEKPGPPKVFDFVYDSNLINFRTEIPPMPEKNKPKPDEKSYTRNIGQLREKYQQLKQDRKKKKTEYKAGSKNYEEETIEIRKKIELGKKCLVVLNFDLNGVESNIVQLEEKIHKKLRLIRNLQRGDKTTAGGDKSYDEMNVHELEMEEERLTIRISTANLNKREETQLNALIGKINRLKRTAKKVEAPKTHQFQIEENKESIEKLKKIKASCEQDKDSLARKMECIRDDIDDFESQLEDFEEKKRNPEISALADEAKQLKQEILKYREQITEMESSFIRQKYEYEYEQEKIKWIKWAKEAKQKFEKEWEAERAERMRQKLKAKTTDTGKDGEQKPYEKKIINRYQKQIDGCTFLIDYCQNLKPKENDKAKPETQTAEEKKNIETALKKGEWAKQKGIEIMKPKKGNPDEQKVEKVNKKKKGTKKDDNDETKGSDNFTHNVFIQNIFDSVKVVPPTNLEQLEKVGNELQSKLQYFVEHPEGPVSRPQRNEKEKPKYTAQKYAKAKQNKKVINTEEFPSLS